CVFDKQSLEPIHCGFSEEKHPFSLSYGVILPSSLTRVVPLTFKYSSCLPVSVYGTGTCYLTRSEEHTSELQSRFELVCRLLLHSAASYPALHSSPTRRSSDLLCF